MIHDLTRQRFGRLLVTGLSHVRDRKSYWTCVCICGQERTVERSNLKSGNTTSCGCFQREIVGKINHRDLAGQRFGRLLVLSRSAAKNGYWNCLCDCGKTKAIEGSHLGNGHTRSCGCLHREKASQRFLIHGCRKTKLYDVWTSMKQRCLNERTRSYATYGGRGIRVCHEWRHDFAAFREWALSHGYADNLTIDRIKSDRNYEPENCQWLTLVENVKKERREKALSKRKAQVV